jgi:putative pyruvate formate lyase activating enzyme
MARSKLELRIRPDGSLEVVDPGFDTLSLLREVDPRFTVQSAPLPAFDGPRFVRANRIGVGLKSREVEQMTLEQLHALHRERLSSTVAAPTARARRRQGEMSLLRLKALIARRMLEQCTLCARRCGANRLAGRTGPCGLGPRAYVAEHFVHIAEEAPINPSLLLSLRGCALRCRYCQQHALLDARGSRAEVLGRSFWRHLDFTGARSMSFIGGNPDESLPFILEFLRHAPGDFSLPVVWNHHAFATIETVDLLEQVVDVYVPDLKYGSDECALHLSGVKGYCATAQMAIQRQLEQGVQVIVRILVLPGHLECCHRPALEFLASLDRPDQLRVSIRKQYAPDWKITASDGLLSRRASASEVAEVEACAAHLGLQGVGAVESFMCAASTETKSQKHYAAGVSRAPHQSSRRSDLDHRRCHSQYDVHPGCGS